MVKSVFDFILFDVIGTTVKDNYNGNSLITDCFLRSFIKYGYMISYDKINQKRGMSKREAIRDMLFESGHDPEMTDKIYNEFIGLLMKSVRFFSEMDEASKLFDYLKERYVKIGLGSGLPKEFLVEIINQVGWDMKKFGYIGSSDELGAGRPDPVMIRDSMNKLNIHDKSRVLKIGDSVADIQEGKNAGVMTAAVLTGTQKKEELERSNPDYIFSDINELRKII